MPVSLCVCSTLRVEPQSGYKEVVAFLRGGESCPLGQADQAKAVALLERHGTYAITLRSDGPDAEILGSICVLEARTGYGASLTVDHPENLNVFLIGGLRVADDACGFDHDVAARMIQEAVVLLATADSDREGQDATPSSVIMIAPTGDHRMRARMESLGAVRVLSPPTWLTSITAMCGNKDQQELWWITRATAREAAVRLRDRSEITVTERTDHSGRARRMRIDVERGWVTSARASLLALSNERFEVQWVPPPSAIPLVVECKPYINRGKINKPGLGIGNT
jgi:hypothetical protein